MSFSFKPEISPQAGADQGGMSSFFANNGSSQPLAARPVEGGMSWIQLMLFVVFGIACLIAIGLFGYKYYLSSQIAAKKAKIAQYEQNLAEFPLEDMRKVSNRIKIINQLINEHPSANVAFRVLEDSVENMITYTNFNLRSDGGKSYSLQMTASAPDYKSIAQQMDTFKRKPYTTYIPDVVVDGLTPDTTGKITFTLKTPILITGILPEELNLSEGAAARVASSTTSAPFDIASSTGGALNASSSLIAPVPTRGAIPSPR
jgi:hypothetical protein